MRFRVLVLCGRVVGLPLETPTRFDVDGDGADQLGQYLARHRPSRPVRVLVMDGGEQFRAEPCALAGGRRRMALAEARASRLFPDADSTLAVPCTTGEETLYAGLAAPDGLQPLLSLLERRHVPLAGVHSPAWVLARAVHDLCSDTCLVMSVHDAGLRQVLLVAGLPRYSRMVPLPATVDAAWYVDACLEMVRQLRARFQSLPVPLEVALYAPGQASRAAAARTDPEVRWHTLPPCADCDRMMALLLSTYHGHPGYAGGAQTAAYRRLRLARRLCAVGLGCGLLGLAAAAGLYTDARALHARATVLLGQVGQARARLSAASEFAAPAADADSVRHAVDTAASLGVVTAAPLPLLRALGAALLREPSLHLERLQWHNDQQGPYLQLQLSTAAAQPSLALWSIDRLAATLRGNGMVVRIQDAPLDTLPGAPEDTARTYFRLRISGAGAQQAIDP